MRFVYRFICQCFLVFCLTAAGLTYAKPLTNTEVCHQSDSNMHEKQKQKHQQQETASIKPCAVIGNLTAVSKVHSGVFGNLVAAEVISDSEILIIKFSTNDPAQFIFLNPYTLERHVVTMDKMYHTFGNMSYYRGISPNKRYVMFEPYSLKSGQYKRFILVDLHSMRFYNLADFMMDKNQIYQQGKIWRDDRKPLNNPFAEGFFGAFVAPVGFGKDSGVVIQGDWLYSSGTPDGMYNQVTVKFAPLDEILEKRQQNVAYSPEVKQQYLPESARKRYQIDSSPKTWQFDKVSITELQRVRSQTTYALSVIDNKTKKPRVTLSCGCSIYPSLVFLDKKNKRTLMFNRGMNADVYIWDYYPK